MTRKIYVLCSALSPFADPRVKANVWKFYSPPGIHQRHNLISVIVAALELYRVVGLLRKFLQRPVVTCARARARARGEPTIIIIVIITALAYQSSALNQS